MALKKIPNDFKERLFEEQEQLQDRIHDLNNYAEKNRLDLEIEEYDLLKEQLHVMNQYENILSLRIELLKT